ncbi:mannose/fructose/sorbose PTS transporter subunit IIA [Yersinia alsatica]|uniref:Mannose/fructose/sorbose PTS transporter subunit IIA n=1 Tax=Yersinia alsatica TaxID=2890317 RepID=A0ABY5URI0_9GAMM|nr:mannose/fructose/sorbose PTS transporter subunit IIA [Yersinia alsatica]OVZ92649.1 PTS sorbose transporter subunit IIA [Yersinia frederiksenii]OWF69498.1 PTS sorbose transporter subunit IIA [Yersinia frederiksenii]OWF83942.1 PTS sorbose transporter subunit IIA [Yersinia frederiksenii]UWM46091.1 mannose/fructose/sorbose PTS transporter subunit IIA [Yersinia alsatica]CNC35231.1 sorbose-specific PTS uptake system component [Yersinia frederiksenii]
MVKVIFCAHGDLAVSMLNSVNMVYGETQNITPLLFNRGENAENLVEKMQDVMAKSDNSSWLIAVDLQGGSPYNAAARLAFGNNHIQVISGLSLPLALEIADNQQTMAAEELTDYLLDIGTQCVQSFRHQQCNEEEEADFI